MMVILCHTYILHACINVYDIIAILDHSSGQTCFQERLNIEMRLSPFHMHDLNV